MTIIELYCLRERVYCLWVTAGNGQCLWVLLKRVSVERFYCLFRRAHCLSKKESILLLQLLYCLKRVTLLPKKVSRKSEGTTFLPEETTLFSEVVMTIALPELPKMMTLMFKIYCGQ